MMIVGYRYLLRLTRAGVLLSMTFGIPGLASARDYAKELPVIPGDFADVGTHRLHYHCVGDGHPTIVIDNGIAGSATDWYPVQDGLAETFRTCVYDRAGYGWSEPGPSPRTTEQITNELRALLDVGGERGPFVVVGHSFGGFTALHFGSRFGDDVVGIVLVDSSSPDVMFDAESAGYGARRNPIRQTPLLDTRMVPSNSAEMARFLNSRRKALFAQMDEIANFEQSAAQVAESVGLADTPLLVVSREPKSPVTDAVREREWRDAQKALTGLSSRAELRVAVGSDHFIHQRQPEWLARTIRRFVMRIDSKDAAR